MTVNAEEAEIPEGFLEFLGMMVEQDGELIDPLTLGRLDDPIAIADEGRSSMDGQAEGERQTVDSGETVDSGQTVDSDLNDDGNHRAEGDPDE